jgi:hypothetical protein
MMRHIDLFKAIKAADEHFVLRQAQHDAEGAA